MEQQQMSLPGAGMNAAGGGIGAGLEASPYNQDTSTLLRLSSVRAVL